MKILLAEDDLVGRMMLVHVLEGWGHQVVAVENGRQAMEVYGNLRPDVVLSDWAMPQMAGLELCRQIRSHREGVYSYFILLTAREGNRESLDEAYAAGVDDFLAKPCHPADLQARLRVAERVSRLEESLQVRIEELARKNEKMRSDLMAAARIQEGLLPTSNLKLAGWDFAWRFVPCEELAGDFLNVLQLDERRVGVYVLDVSGHGVAAALMSVSLSQLLSESADRSLLFRQRGDGRCEPLPPARVMHLLNQRYQITNSIDGQYFTILYGVLDMERNCFRYSVAGHPSGLVRRADGECMALEGGDLPIGFLEEAEYREWDVTLEPGDRVFLFSDGLTEISNGGGAEYGVGGLSRFLCSQSKPIDEVVSGIVGEALQWHGKSTPEDDVSLLAFERST